MPRDEWMLHDGGRLSSSSKKSSNPQEKKRGYRELNPYYADGGSGLPPTNHTEDVNEENDQVASRKARDYHSYTKEQHLIPIKKCLACTSFSTDPLVIAKGQFALVRRPSASLHSLHLQILPIVHTLSTRFQANEPLAIEIRNFKKSILKLWSGAFSQSCPNQSNVQDLSRLGVFCEVATGGGHACIDAIPQAASGTIDPRVTWFQSLQGLSSGISHQSSRLDVSSSDPVTRLTRERPARVTRDAYVVVEFWLDDGFEVRFGSLIRSNEDAEDESFLRIRSDWARQVAASFLPRESKETSLDGYFSWTRSQEK